MNRLPGGSVMPGSRKAWIRGIDVVPLLEREAQLASLAEYAGEAREGDGRLVLIAGEAGGGKAGLVAGVERGLPGATPDWGGCGGVLAPRALRPPLRTRTQT